MTKITIEVHDQAVRQTLDALARRVANVEELVRHSEAKQSPPH